MKLDFVGDGLGSRVLVMITVRYHCGMTCA